MSKDAMEKLQMNLCSRYGAEYLPSPSNFKVGISENVRDQIDPINGLRHPPKGDTTGWYIYAGEVLSDDPEFFLPLHVAHVKDWCPQVGKYLGLAPGWRFLIAADFEDVWFDDSLLEI